MKIAALLILSVIICSPALAHSHRHRHVQPMVGGLGAGFLHVMRTADHRKHR